MKNGLTGYHAFWFLMGWFCALVPFLLLSRYGSFGLTIDGLYYAFCAISLSGLIAAGLKDILVAWRSEQP